MADFVLKLLARHASVQAGVHVVAGQPAPSTARVVASLWRAGGMRAFYAGFDSTVMRDVPFSAFQLLLLEQGKRAYERANHGQQTPPLGVALIGGLSGGCAAALTTPLDVIKACISYSLRATCDVPTFYYYMWLFFN